MLALGTLLLGLPVGARVEAESGYSKAQTYSGALRYLRVDLGYEVLEKDADAAYLVFRYLPPGQPKSASTGTLEVVDRGDGVRVFVRLPSMPEYHEVVLRDGLMKKLRDEYGVPPQKKPAAKPAPTTPAPDAGPT
jgi:hypothetical protein